MYAPQLFPSRLLQSLVSLLLIFLTSHAQDDEQFSECYSYLYNCSQAIQNIRYPFWGDSRLSFCGLEGFGLRCHNNEYSTIDINDQTFRVLRIDQSTRAMRIARNDLWEDICPLESIRNITRNEILFRYDGLENENITLFYNCPSWVNGPVGNNFTCLESTGFFADEWFSEREACGMNMSVPVLRSALEEFRNTGEMSVRELVNRGFNVQYIIDDAACSTCQRSGGLCWNSANSPQSRCLCPNGPQPSVCPSRSSASDGGLNLGLKIGIGFGAAGVTICFMCLIFFFYQRWNKKRYAGSYLISRNISSHPSSMMDLEKASTYLGVHIFTYNELEKATNKFDSEKTLGDGGFGTVYQGKLRDGRVVAVKRLYENNYKRVEQFVNEVEILARLRHQNLVSLYGCTTHHGRELLLVYEYVPNGTVADHLHGERAKPGALPWNTRMSIAIETASALVYLHASDVIHRDVKTNNILLDNNFVVKVADFGLSRLFPTDVTHVSTAPQGTPGYVDPEYHECYQLTDKSDVFSFGVVLVELISSKPAVDITRHRHEINLSNMAINKIQNHMLHEFVDPCLGFESDYKVRKMIKAVAELAFQCLQNGKEMRPSMGEVLEDLKGIQGQDYDIEKKEGVDVLADDVVLLKNNSQILSPDSVTVKWVSGSTTSSSSTG